MSESLTPSALSQAVARLKDWTIHPNVAGFPRIDDCQLVLSALAAAAKAQQQLQDERDCWFKTAGDMADNATFYRGLVVKIGERFGVAARTSDDGSVQEDVLALKVPELVEALQSRADALAQKLERLETAAQNLLTRLVFVHSHPHYAKVWHIAQLHNGPYAGPTYSAEVAALQALLPAKKEI